MSAIRQAAKALRKNLSGRDVAEMEIEARREAVENHYNARLNPFKPGSFESLCYTSECSNHWKEAVYDRAGNL